MDNTQLHIDDMLANFDFNKVEAAMRALNWKWCIDESTLKFDVPSVEEMKAFVVELVKDLNELHPEQESDAWIGSGGFTVIRYTDGSYKLLFVVEEHETYLNVGSNRIKHIAAKEGEVEMA